VSGLDGWELEVWASPGSYIGSCRLRMVWVSGACRCGRGFGLSVENCTVDANIF